MVEKKNKKYKSLLGVFLKTSKKRLLISVLVSFFLFLLLTTFLLTWFNYRYKSFENYYTDYDWYDDSRVSISTRYLSLKNDTDTYLALAVDELHATLDDLAAGMFDNYTASMQYKMESINYNLTQIYDASLLTLQQEAFDILTTRFVEGRLPYTESELIYYPSDLLSPNYQIGDQLGLQVTMDGTSYTHNFTIVGIIDSVSHTLYQNGYSNDIFEFVRVSGEEFDHFKMDLFFTNPQLFVDIVANYPYYQTGSLTFKMDFNYQFDVKDSCNLLTIASELNVIQAYSDFEYFDIEISHLCSDLESFIFGFELNWLSQTLTIFVLGVPIFLLFGLLIIELFNTGNFEKTAQFKLFKTYGLEFATLRKILFTENLITASIGFFAGVPLGILIGFAISSFSLDVTPINLYFTAFLEPTVSLILLALFLLLLIGGFVTETVFAKRTVQLTSEIFKSKRKKFIRRLFTSVESLFLISGVITIVVGLLSWLYISSSYYAISTFIVLLNISLVLMIIGILLTITSLFLILSRLLVFLCRYVGKKIWQRRKSYFTLALKQLSIYSNDYKRAIFAMLLISLCVSPGLVMTKSSNDHLEMEANLKVGFSDVIIQTWADNNAMLMENISTITDVDLLTKVEVVTIRLGNVRATSSEKAFYVDILNIYNVTDFIDIISANFPDSCKYTLADIAKLETNMTYMMSSKYAQRKNYDKKALYTSSEITSSNEDSYDMTFINKFDCFPLLPYKSTNFLERVVEDRYNLVMSNLTFSQLRYKFGYSTSVSNDTYILVRTTSTANNTLIANEIKNLPYDIHVTTFEDELSALNLTMNKFAFDFLIVVTIITFILVIFYGFLTARNIYKQKMRIVETEYNVGARKYQILFNFSIELLLALIVPLVISIITSSTLLYTVYDYFFSIPQSYKKFVPWLPVWFIVLILLFCLVSISIGWLLELWNQFHRYRPARQE